MGHRCGSHPASCIRGCCLARPRASPVSKIQLPAQYEVRHHIDKNPVFRLRRTAWSGEAEVSGYTQHRIHGLLAILPDGSRIIVVPRAIEPLLASDCVLLAQDVEIIRRFPRAETGERW